MNWTSVIIGICLGILVNIDKISEYISNWIKR
jgi:hypothetical protein